MSPEERICEALGVSYLTYTRLSPTQPDRHRIDSLAAALTTAIDEALGELREWVLGFPPPNEPEEYTAHCERGRVAREIDRRRKALRGEQ